MEQAAGSYFDIIFFAILAAAIFFKLFSVLGKTDDTPPPVKRDDVATGKKEDEKAPAGMTVHAQPKLAKGAKSARTAPKIPVEPVYTDTHIVEGLNAIKLRDAQFSAGVFLEGAKMAFEMVLKALQDGDKATLKNLLSAEVYKDFARELEVREKSGHFPEVTLVSTKRADIVEAGLDKNCARVSVEFVSEQIHIVRDAERKIIEGDPSDVIEIKDIWVFERDVRSTNPNWTIVET